MRKYEILSRPTRPLSIDKRKSTAALLEKMQGISFQGRNLGIAYQVWKKMLGDRVMIMMGMSGAMVPAGMRRLVVYMIKNRLIDSLTTTGANLFHDIHETLGRYHYQCSPEIDDVMLQKHLIDRMYDTLADEEEFREADAMIGAMVEQLNEAGARVNGIGTADRSVVVLGDDLDAGGLSVCRHGFSLTPLAVLVGADVCCAAGAEVGDCLPSFTCHLIALIGT